MSGVDLQYGVLLPHFGSHATPNRLLEGVRKIEAYGFDSVWVRDHVVYHPHEHEDQDRTHLDPFVVLSAAAAATSRVTLATGTLIPHRHPIHAALMLGSLDWISGGGRVLAGWGIGTYQHEFEAVGLGKWDRRELLEEYVAILRALWSGGDVSHHGAFFNFDDVEIRPVPGPSRTIPVWYGGASKAAVRRAVEYCDGWIPGRAPRFAFTSLMQRMRRLAEDAGKPLPRTGNIPYVSPAKTVEEGARAFRVEALLQDTQNQYGIGPNGEMRTLADLDGAAIAGPSEVIVEEVRRHQEAGVEHFVFDMRSRFEEWEDCLGIIGEEVLPQLRATDRRPGTLAELV
jgi:probable F420-dependent oxidoreductase